MPSYVETLRLIVQLRERDVAIAEDGDSEQWETWATGALAEARDLLATEVRALERQDAGRQPGRRH